MSKVVVIGSLNMDLSIKTGRMPKMGETIFGEGFNQIPGGKGANQAAACAKLGADTAMLGRIGKDSFGEELKNNLSSIGVDVQSVIKDDEEKTGIAMIVVCNGENLIILNEGSNKKVSVKDIDDNADLIDKAEIIVLQLEIPLETVEYVIKKYKNKKKIFLDPAPIQKLSDEILNGLDYISPNEHEAELLCGIKTDTEEGVFNALDYLHEKGVKCPIITLGGKGAAFYNDGVKKIIPARKVNVVDTTAAGDTFAGAFISSLLKGKTTEEAIVFAQKAGALATTKYGAQSSIPTLLEVENADI